MWENGLEIDVVVKHAAGIFNRKPRKEMGTFVHDRHLQFERNPGRCFFDDGPDAEGRTVRLVTQGNSSSISRVRTAFRPNLGPPNCRNSEIIASAATLRRKPVFCRKDDLISISRFFSSRCYS
jgi:hypothetical protein